MIPGFSGHLISESFLEQHVHESSVTALDDKRHQGRLIEWRRQCKSLGPASSLRTLLETAAEPFFTALGFVWLGRVASLKNAVAATLLADREPVALVLTAWADRLDPFWRQGVGQAVERHARWCVLFNGVEARLIEARRLYSRRHTQFDIDIALEDSRAFAALAMILSAQALATDSPSESSPVHLLIEASERHSAHVCQSLRAEVLEASAELLSAIVTRPPRQPLHEIFEQTLTIVYRILFLLFAEARRLVPLWHPVYRESYSIESLREIAERDRTPEGLWEALRAIGRLAHAGCRAGDLHVNAFNGRLFAPSRTPLAEARHLDDRAARRVVLALTTRAAPDRQGRERIAYRDLGVEQLGAVYETLLDYEPRAEQAARPTERRGAMVVSLRAGSGLRKSTGTFYTPQPIAQYLVRRTLGPLVHNRTPDQILDLRVLDPAMGSGAFLVAACMFLAQSYEAALVRAGGYHPSDFGPKEQMSIRRTIAERCLFGVDLNPMAVQLARLSLWLATLAADQPLSFLDHHLATGDSLLGARLTDIRQPPAVRRKIARTLLLFDEDALGDVMRTALPARFTLATPNDTADEVRQKERVLADLNRLDTPLSKWKRVADLWCAHWFSSDAGDAAPASAFGALSDLLLTGRGLLPDRTASRYLRESEAVAARHRFFHWELEFPEAYFGANGTRQPVPGFDAVIGNPPWDMVRADAGSSERRAEARREASAVLRFTRDSGVYEAQSAGHANRYQLFVERAVALTRHGGRIGLVLPWGLAADHGSASLRRLLFSRCAVDSLVGFDNRQRVFPIHRSIRFLLLSATAGIPTTQIGCRLGEHDPSCLEAAEDPEGDDAWFPVRVTPTLLERLSGPGLAVPDIRTPRDLAIMERSAWLFPPLGEGPWAARFGRELNATDDRDAFQPPGCGLPIVEGKLVAPFRVDLSSARWSISPREADRRLASRQDYRRPRLAYRDVASATNKHTLIAAVMPARSVSTHTVCCLQTALPLRSQYLLCGFFNSFVVNYLVRLRVTTHVTTAIVEGLPIPRMDDAPSACREIAALARILARRSNPLALARLNARVAQLYQLSVSEFEFVLSTFPLVPVDERNAALREFERSGSH